MEKARRANMPKLDVVTMWICMVPCRPGLREQFIGSCIYSSEYRQDIVKS